MVHRGRAVAPYNEPKRQKGHISMAAIVTLTVWIVWLIFYWRGGLKTLKDIRAAEQPLDRVILIGITCLNIVLVLLLVETLLRGDPSGALNWVGVGVAVLGVSGTFYARHTLGRFWTAQNALQTDHQIVSSGVYGIVRHPIYTACLLMYAGTWLVVGTPFALIVALAICALYVLKTVNEDRFLRASLPGYDAYAARVRYRLVPLVW